MQMQASWIVVLSGFGSAFVEPGVGPRLRSGHRVVREEPVNELQGGLEVRWGLVARNAAGKGFDLRRDLDAGACVDE